MPSYRVLSPVKAGGRRHEPGETVQLPEPAAAAAVAVGALAPLPASPAPEAGPKKRKG